MGSFGGMNSFGIGMIRMKNVRQDEVLERNKNLNRGFRKLVVWRKAIELYVFVKQALDEVKKSLVVRTFLTMPPSQTSPGTLGHKMWFSLVCSNA